MKYEVKTISVFEKQFKRLAKKYSSLKADMEDCDLTYSPFFSGRFTGFGKVKHRYFQLGMNNFFEVGW